jgi:hypothetical protein
MRINLGACVCSVALHLVCMHANAAVVEYEQKSAWVSAVADYTTINFTGYPANTIITTQYAFLGTIFTDETDRINLSSNAYPNDGAGLYGALNEIHIAFSEPMTHIAVEFPGTVQYRLYWKGQLTYSSSVFVHVGAGFFAGLVSDQPFDAAVILDPGGDVFIDDLHFGPPIPTPGALALLALPLLARWNRLRVRER